MLEIGGVESTVTSTEPLNPVEVHVRNRAVTRYM
jgi:hypothetical protein